MADETTGTAESVSETAEALDPTNAIGTVDSSLLGGSESVAEASATDTAGSHVPQHAAGDSVEGYKPVFSERVRQAVYIVGLLVSFAAFVITGLSSDLPRVVVEVASLIGTGFGTLAAGFGVAYVGK